jgi:hypothetical protein
MAADALGVVVHDFLPGFIPVVSLVRALADADLAIDAQIRVPVDTELMVVLVDGLKKQDRSPLSFIAKKVISEARQPEWASVHFTIQELNLNSEGQSQNHKYVIPVKKSFNILILLVL